MLMGRLRRAPAYTAAEWGRRMGYQTIWAGRGTPGGDHADQIHRSLATGQLSMPLWGVSLSAEVASEFGDRFTFEIVGSFPAIVANHHSASSSTNSNSSLAVDTPLRT